MHNRNDKPLPRVTLTLWSDAHTGRWAWCMRSGRHAIEDAGQQRAPRTPQTLAREVLGLALARLKKTCRIDIYQYPDTEDTRALPLPDFISPDDVSIWYTQSDDAPTMATLRTIAHGGVRPR